MPELHIANEIRFSGVRSGIGGQTVAQVIKNLSLVISSDIKLPSPHIQHRLEHIFATSISGIGDGIAVFDWIDDDINEPYLLCARLGNGVNFSSVDDRRVDIVLVLVSPRKTGPLHLQYLARVTRMFRETPLVEKIRSVESADGISSVLSPENRKLSAA